MAEGHDSVSAPDAAPSVRERILASATDLFYREGVRAVGVDTIVARSGVAKMSLYRCFPSKDALVAAFLEQQNERYWRWWDGVVARHPGAPVAQLHALVAAVAKRTTSPTYRGCPFINVATELREGEHLGRSVAAANKRELRRRLAGLAAAAGAGRPDALGDQLMLLFEGAYAAGQTLGPEGPGLAVIEAAARLIEAATRPEAGPAAPG
jgi:AcrR family transcriptional regulator